MSDGAIIYFEAGGRDAAALKRFYADLFGWDVRPAQGDGYGVVSGAGESGVPGGIHGFPHGAPYVTVYVRAADVEEALERASRGGADVVLPKRDNETFGISFGAVRDPEGNMVGVMNPGDGFPAGGGGAPVDWLEIEAEDPSALKAFYREAFGWEIGDGEYAMIDAPEGEDGRHLHGGFGPARGAKGLTWYARVEDIDATAERATALGGSIDTPPTKAETVVYARLRDPEGNRFGVYVPA